MKKKRLKKSTAVLLSVAMILGLMPAVSKPLEVKAEGNTAPLVSQFATKAELMENFDLEDTTKTKTVQKVIFGQNGSGSAQEWLIVGKDPDTAKGDNIVLFAAASPLVTKAEFNSSAANTTYNGTEVYANHYGASELWTTINGLLTGNTYFSDTEQGLMNTTTIITNDTKNSTNYTITDKLYAAYGVWHDEYITVGTNSSGNLNDGLKIDKSNLSVYCWLRAPNNLYDNYALLAVPGDFVININVRSHFAVVPAFDLNLSSVIFASATSAVSSEGIQTLGDAFTLRYTPATTFGTATLTSGKTMVDISNASDKTYLVVQNSAGAWAKAVSGDMAISAKDVDSSLTTFEGCKVWLETTDSDRITYAEEASIGTDTGVSITAGSNMTKTDNSGSEGQIIESGAMTSVIYTADTGYYFPTSYNEDNALNSNGIIVTRDSDTEIIVSGTPTADTNITLTASTAYTYTITASPTSKDFGSKNQGYGEIATQTITVTNTGNSEVTLQQPTSTNYTIGDLSATTLAPGATATFTVTPNTGLTAGTYNETITVTTTQSTSAEVSVKFKVNGVFSVGISPETPTIINGDSVTLTVNPAGGRGSYTYKWYAGNDTAVLGTDKTYTVSPDTTTTYKVVVNDNIEDKEVSATVTVNPKTYAVNVNDGMGDGSLTMTCSGELDKLTGIYVDGIQIDSSNYTLKSGSTILTLNKTYLNTISAGTHTLRFQYSDGYADTTFVVKAADSTDTTDSTDETTSANKDEVPKTGDNTPAVWLFVVVIISGAGILYFGRNKKAVR